MLPKQISNYQIISKLGAGGMGEVYLAEDTRLQRRVALKILPPNLAGDKERMRRFVQEAKAAAALNHPHVAHIFEFGSSPTPSESDAETIHFIAMEFIDGVTLKEKIHREKAPLVKLLKYLAQVAEALAKAHSAGIVHRDLKPDNIMVTRDNYAKVLDFGLAKLLEPNSFYRSSEAPEDSADKISSDIATAVLPHSIPGVVVGTVGYMSPEQALGRVNEIDNRTDIFSFGCILYEAVTRQRAFAGKDLLDSLHKIVHAPAPQLTAVSPDAPAILDRIVRRCLAKDPERRYQSIKDVGIELEETAHELTTNPDAVTGEASAVQFRVSSAATTTVARDAAGATTSYDTALDTRSISSAEYIVRTIKSHKLAAILVAALLAASVASYLLLRRNSLGAGPPKSFASFQTMKLTRLTTSGRAVDAAISPDGKYVAYINLEYGSAEGRANTGSIWIRQVATSRNIKIVESGEFIARGLTFSPDSNYLYYRSQKPTEGGWLFRISVLGGDSQKLTSNVYSAIGFSPDGNRIAFVRNHFPVNGNSNLVVSNADGTQERTVAAHKGELFAIPSRPTAPAWSPDGRVLACVLGNVEGSLSLLEINVETGAEKQIGAQQWSSIDSVAWLPDGSALLLTGRDRSSPQAQIWQVAYPSGEAQRVTNDLNDYRGMSLSADARLMVVTQLAREANLWLVTTGKPGEARALTSGAGKSDGGGGLSWTPDGQIVYESNASGNRDIWLLDPSSGTQKQLTVNTRQNWHPVVTSDGRYIVFLSDRGAGFGLWRIDFDGSNPKLLSGTRILRFSCSPDGKWVVYSGLGTRGVPTLWRISIEGGDPVELNDQFWKDLPSFSPDGKHIAFQYFNSNFAATIGLVSLEGGQITKLVEPPFRLSPTMRWTPDGQGIAYIDNGQGTRGNIWVLPLDRGKPKQLTDLESDFIFWFDWSRDGKQLALSRGTQISDVVMISNFR